jgi:hypothetical protein
MDFETEERAAFFLQIYPFHELFARDFSGRQAECVSITKRLLFFNSLDNCLSKFDMTGPHLGRDRTDVAGKRMPSLTSE